MSKAYSYIRFSTPEQRLGDSLRRQIAQAQAYAEANGLEFDDTFRDEGRSAFRGSHRDDKAALGAFLASVEQGRIGIGSHLLIESLDRLSREQVATALRLFLNILEKGIIIVTIADNRVYSNESVSADPVQLIISIAVMMRAHDESRIKSQRISAAWKNKRSLARSENRAMTKVCPGWLRKDGERYVEHPERAEVVRRIFELSIEGYGTQAIAKSLNEQGEPVFGRGKIWHDSYIKKILDNPAAYGRFVPGASSSISEPEDPIDGYFPAVIDEQTFYRSQAAFRSRATSNVRSPAGKSRNLMSGLARCGSCGGGMHYIDKGWRRGGLPYLQCGSSRLNGGCQNRMRYRYRTAEVALIVVSRQALAIGPSARESDDVYALEARRNDLEARLGRLLDMAEAGSEPGKALGDRINSLEAELVVVEAALENGRKATAVAVANPLKESLEALIGVYEELQNAANDSSLRRRAAATVRKSLRSFTFGDDGIAHAEFVDGRTLQWQRMI